MKNKILSAIISIVLMISLVGCQQNNKIIRPDVETKTVTEKIMFLLPVLVLKQTKQMPAIKFLPTS